MHRFDTVIVVDWSAANRLTSQTRLDNAIWIGVAEAGHALELHVRSRAAAEAWLVRKIAEVGRAGQRALIGFDFAMGYPAGFASALTGTASTKAVWAWFAGQITDTPDNHNNRFEVANRINAQFDHPGPFWSHPARRSYSHLGPRKAGIDHGRLGFAEYRLVEHAAKGAKSVWMLFNPGSVGSQTLLGLPMIHRLSTEHGCAVWPFDAPTADVVLAEVYPSLLASEVTAEMAALVAGKKAVKDQVQVRLLARALLHLSQAGSLAPLLEAPDAARAEGWILGAGHAPALRNALR